MDKDNSNQRIRPSSRILPRSFSKVGAGTSSPVVVDFSSFAKSVPKALDAIGAAHVLRKEPAVLIKPNLVNDSPHPVTTAPECCRAVIEYVRSVSEAEIIIAEGTGDADRSTGEVFDRLGYTALAAAEAVALVDLNRAPLRRLENRNCIFFPEIYLPEIVFTCFVISLPVLKAHSLSDITGTLKNMIGLAPPEHYAGRFGTWKKAAVHEDMHRAIVELNQYRSPDLSVMDAVIGLAEHHLGGARCDPPVGKILAGFDPLALDREAAELLGKDWRTIPHLQ